MDIEVRYKPYFQLQMSVVLIDRLMKLADAHYDGRCRQAGRVGGFIYGWNNHATFAPEESAVEVSANPDELDTCMKICELARTLLAPADLLLVNDFRKAVGVAMVQAKVWESAPLVGMTDL